MKPGQGVTARPYCGRCKRMLAPFRTVVGQDTVAIVDALQRHQQRCEATS